MRKGFLSFFLLLLTNVLFGQIVKWTFETSIPTTPGPHAAEIGTGQALGFHAGSPTYSNPVGNGSAESFSSSDWAIGDYYQFQFQATGYQDISITWDATSSNTGPRDFKVQYSTDGTTFTDAIGINSTYQITVDAWSSLTYNPLSTRTLDLSSVTALNNAASVFIRLIVTSTVSANGTTVAAGGTSRVDNFTVNGNLFTTNTIALGAISSTIFNLPDCFTSAPGTVDFISSGTFTAGNIYTAQLSDASGSFATAVTIGTLSSTANSGTINITIPSGTASGTLYKIRIRSSAPVVTSNSSADITINLTGPCVSAATDFFRSRATGNWNATATWESSATGTAGTWITATLTPNFNARTISIRNGNSVTVTASVTVDEVVIENGGILINDIPASNSLTFNNGTGNDMEILSGGTYHILSEEGYNNYQVINSGATVMIRTGGKIKVGDGTVFGGSGNHQFASIASTYVWENASIFEWNSLGAPAASGVTYFPDANASTIPVLRILLNTGNVGGGTNTRINGVLEANGNIPFIGTGTKTFRNGIRGNGKVNGTTSGKFIIDGVSAELGGDDTLFVPITGGLEIGSSTITTVDVIADKIVSGNINLLSTDSSFVDLGANNLTVTGSISGGSLKSYIRTAGTGSLILNTVDFAGKTFPVGHSRYNPLLIEKGNNYQWKVSVYDSITADPPQNTTGAVNVTWQIEPSTNPPASGADITFQFDTTAQVGGSFNVIPYIGQEVQAWHRKDQYYWLAAGTPASLTVIGNTGTVKALGLTEFCPYALARTGLPLPIKLISFDAVKISSSSSRLSWELAACCSSAARFEIERSTDARNYSLLSSLPGSETNRFYAYTDTRLARGITYYRLKMIDADGKITYSNVVALINDKAGLLITTLAPNPVQSQATLSITNAGTGPVQFAIYDLRGRVVQQWQGNAGEGSTRFTLQLGGLRAGVYHLLATGAGARSVYRFIKQ